MNIHQQITIIRHKQELIPTLARRWADRIFEEILKGDELQDEIDELFTEIYRPSDFDSPEDHGPLMDDLIDGVWAQILHRVHQNIRETQ